MNGTEIAELRRKYNKAGGPGLFGLLGVMSIGTYNWTSLIFILLFWFSECLFLVALLEQALYKNVRKAQPTTEKIFHYAASHNLMIGEDNFDPAKCSATIFRIVRWIIVAMNLYSIYVVYQYIQSFGQPIEPNQDFWGTGIIWFVLILFYNQNNPIRLVKIMKLYSQGKVLFKKEQDESGA